MLDEKGMTEHERVCFGAGMRQWHASSKRPDLDEEARVRGALLAYQRQAFVFSTTPAGGDVGDEVVWLRDLDGTGSMHACSQGDPGAVEYVHATALEQMRAERDEALALADRLKLEAQIHAGEARGANHTIYKIYQAISGATGERGNWNGAQPVIDYITAAQSSIKELEGALSETLEVASRNELGEYINRAKRALTSKGDGQ